MKPRDLGVQYRIAAISSDLSTTLRIFLRFGRDDCRELIDSFYNAIGTSKVSQCEPELSGKKKIREMAEEKSHQSQLGMTKQAYMAFLPGIFPYFRRMLCILPGGLWPPWPKAAVMSDCLVR